MRHPGGVNESDSPALRHCVKLHTVRWQAGAGIVNE
jgi:hypothetical protein